MYPFSDSPSYSDKRADDAADDSTYWRGCYTTYPRGLDCYDSTYTAADCQTNSPKPANHA